MTASTFDLRAAADLAARDAGFVTELSEPARTELTAIVAAHRDNLVTDDGPARDLRDLRWSSIDNADTLDLDQVEVAEARPDGATRVLVGVADVDALVRRGSALDAHAAANTTSVYTGVAIFPMLPPILSTDRTSLVVGAARRALVVDMIVDRDGEVASAEVYVAIVVNRAKLAYETIGPWLAGTGPMPDAVRADPELEAQLRLQHAAADRLRGARDRRGALDLETIEARPIVEGGRVTSIAVTMKSSSRELIEDFMIAANASLARFLESHGVASIRRVVRTPERWPRIVALARAAGATLPDVPDSLALAAFLRERRRIDPSGFADLSLAIVKLLGPGEYAVELPGDTSINHFGLAEQDYGHGTAPNRRYADLVTHRLAKAVLAGAPPPYPLDALTAIARQCTLKENDARKVERQTRKEAAAALLAPRVGETFRGIVTGVTPKGIFVRLVEPAAEGRVMSGGGGYDVGDAVRVRLVHTDPARGFVDFVAA